MKTIEEKKQRINEYLKHSEEITNLFYDLLELRNASFREITTFCGLENNKIDSAYPSDYGKSIREIYPNFDKLL
jgi:hypothetical protein